MYAVNLIPDDCLEAQHRRARLKGWIVIASAVAAVSVGCYAHYWMTRQMVWRLESQLARVQVTQSDLDRRVVQIQAESDATVAKASALIGLQLDHPVPNQLRTLAAITPDHVVLKHLTTSSAAPGRRGRPALPTSIESGALVLQITGHAADHAELERFIEGLQHIPEWRRVDLLRAVREPYRTGELLAFELLCGAQEARQ